MNLIETTRRFFKFECDGGWNFDFGDIRACGGAIWFQRPAIYETHRHEFGTVESCKQWILGREAVKMEGFVANKRLDKRLYDVKSTALKINDKEWEIVSQYMINPERFNPETDVKVFRTYLANNFRDRDGERFSKPVLNSFNKSIVGKSKLIGHQWGPPGDGRFYASKVESMSVDDVLEVVGAQPDKKFREHLELVEERDGGIYWLVPKYYMVNITPEQQQSIINIEAGIWKDMSIGFRAPSKYAVFADGKEAPVGSDEYYELKKDNPVLFLEFRNDKDVEAEALEGSHVFLGSQFGAGTTKGFDDLERKIDSLEKVIGELGSKVGGRMETIEKQTDGKCTEEKGKIDNKDEEESKTKTDDNEPTQDKNGDETMGWIDIETIEDDEIRYYVRGIDGLIQKELDINTIVKAVWTTAQINQFEDECFAYVENTGEKDEEDRTIPKNARHLPHHAKGNGASGTGGTVDLPHLRNALARVNQVQPVTNTVTAATLQSRAKAHLVAHAKKLGIGDYDSFVAAETDEEAKAEPEVEPENTNNPDTGEKIMKEFQIKAFDVEVTVNDEKFEDGLKELQLALDGKQEELDQKLADLDQQVKDMADKMAENDEAIAGLKGEKEALEAYKKSVTDVFGEDAKPEDMKQAKDTAAAFREYEISNRFLKYKGLMGMIDNEEEERKFLETLTTAEITKQANYYEKEIIRRNPQLQGVLPINKDELVTEPNLDKDKPKKVELPVSQYRW